MAMYTCFVIGSFKKIFVITSIDWPLRETTIQANHGQPVVYNDLVVTSITQMLHKKTKNPLHESLEIQNPYYHTLEIFFETASLALFNGVK